MDTPEGHRKHERARSACALTVMVVVGAAGALKLFDLPDFRADLATWNLIPEVWKSALAVLVPIVEVGLSLMWLLDVGRGPAIRAVTIVLIAFSGAYVAHLLFAERPSCGCLGKVLAFEHGRQQDVFLLTRNAVLIALTIYGARRVSTNHTAKPEAVLPGSRTHAARGFTLVELILVVVLVVILVAISLPSLGRVRAEARRAVSLSNLRGHGQILTTYTSDWNDRWPYFTTPGAFKSVVRNGDAIAATVDYFGAHSVWNIALAQQYYAGNHRSDSFFPPGFRERGWTGSTPEALTPYYLPCAFIASADYWNVLTRSGPAQWRPTKHADVVFPAAKCLLFSMFPYMSQGPTNRPKTAGPESEWLMVDGSADKVLATSISPGMRGGDGKWPGAVHGIPWPPAMHTIDGVRGRDK